MLLTSFRIPENQIFQRPTTTVPHVCWSSWIELMRREMQATRQELMNAVLNTVRVASPKQRQEMKEALLRQQAHQKALVQPQSPSPKQEAQVSTIVPSRKLVLFQVVWRK